MQKCTFSINGIIETIEIAWRPIDNETFTQNRMAQSNPTGCNSFCIEEFGKNSIWVRLPHFFPTDNELNDIRAVIKKLASCKDKDRVIFDIRGNCGGNDNWGERVLASLYGKKYIDNLSAANTSVGEMCATKELLKKYEFFSKKEKLFGKESASYKETKKTIEQIKKALQLSPMSLIPDGDSHRITEVIENEICTKSIVITDYACVSAALSFIDLIKTIPGSKQVGLPTFTDTIYNDAHFVSLPSNNAKLMYPTKLYTDQIRKNNEPHIPDVRYNGNICNTDKLKKWIQEQFSI